MGLCVGDIFFCFQKKDGIETEEISGQILYFPCLCIFKVTGLALSFSGRICLFQVYDFNYPTVRSVTYGRVIFIIIKSRGGDCTNQYVKSEATDMIEDNLRID